MLNTLTSRELTEWAAYYSVCPFGDEVADLRHAVSTAILSAAHGGKAEVDDFRLGKQKEKKRDLISMRDKIKAQLTAQQIRG